MANLLKPTAGAINAWTSCGFTASDFNSIASGTTVFSDAAITNTSNLDMYANVSFSIEVGGTTAAGAILMLFVLPLNRDGTTYGDGRGVGDANLVGAFPGFAYMAGVAPVRVGVTSGNAVTGYFMGRGPGGLIELPRHNFLFAVGNGLGVAADSTANAAFDYQTTLLNLNG